MQFHSAARHLPILVFTCIIGGCASGQTPQETTQPAAVVTTETGTVVSMPTELVTVHPAFIKAWQGTDPMALRVYFTDNATVTTPEDKFAGWADIHARWIAPVLPDMSGFSATPKSFVREGAEIIENGEYSFTLTREGKTDDIKGSYTQRWQKQPDGTWRVTTVSVQ